MLLPTPADHAVEFPFETLGSPACGVPGTSPTLVQLPASQVPTFLLPRANPSAAGGHASVPRGPPQQEPPSALCRSAGGDRLDVSVAQGTDHRRTGVPSKTNFPDGQNTGRGCSLVLDNPGPEPASGVNDRSGGWIQSSRRCRLSARPERDREPWAGAGGQPHLWALCSQHVAGVCGTGPTPRRAAMAMPPI